VKELHLRRHNACNPLAFDAVHVVWRRDMMRKAIKRDALGRFTTG